MSTTSNARALWVQAQANEHSAEAELDMCRQNTKNAVALYKGMLLKDLLASWAPACPVFYQGYTWDATAVDANGVVTIERPLDDLGYYIFDLDRGWVSRSLSTSTIEPQLQLLSLSVCDRDIWSRPNGGPVTLKKLAELIEKAQKPVPTPPIGQGAPC